MTQLNYADIFSGYEYVYSKSSKSVLILKNCQLQSA